MSNQEGNPLLKKLLALSDAIPDSALDDIKMKPTPKQIRAALIAYNGVMCSQAFKHKNAVVAMEAALTAAFAVEDKE